MNFFKPVYAGRCGCCGIYLVCGTDKGRAGSRNLRAGMYQAEEAGGCAVSAMDRLFQRDDHDLVGA